ncbi:MAG TPA: hypothetical protein PLB62_08165, partial [Candidatus Sumerlaeota bacterium]|nr:hypothetical protein [Candidatus Sumerlaeota bacterium]
MEKHGFPEFQLLLRLYDAGVFPGNKIFTRALWMGGGSRTSPCPALLKIYGASGPGIEAGAFPESVKRSSCSQLAPV